LSLERAQAEVRINILACNDNWRKYGTKQGRVLCIWMGCEVAVLQRNYDLECHFVKSNGYQMVPITFSSNFCPNKRTARSLAPQRWERWISDWDWSGTRGQLLNKPLMLSYHIIYHIIYFHSVDPYRITKSIWIWK
jgi:hypothetical protein